MTDGAGPHEGPALSCLLRGEAVAMTMHPLQSLSSPQFLVYRPGHGIVQLALAIVSLAIVDRHSG